MQAAVSQLAPSFIGAMAGPRQSGMKMGGGGESLFSSALSSFGKGFTDQLAGQNSSPEEARSFNDWAVQKNSGFGARIEEQNKILAKRNALIDEKLENFAELLENRKQIKRERKVKKAAKAEKAGKVEKKEPEPVPEPISKKQERVREQEQEQKKKKKKNK